MILDLCIGLVLVIFAIGVVATLNTFVSEEKAQPLQENDVITSAETDVIAEMHQLNERLDALDSRTREIRDGINKLLGYYDATYSGTVASAVDAPEAVCSCIYPTTNSGGRCTACKRPLQQ